MLSWVLIMFSCVGTAFFFRKQLREVAAIDRSVEKIKADAAKM
ncbi:MAG: hypothetical protein WCK46_02955 [Candidatus Adlerbacteria bacterium]